MGARTFLLAGVTGIAALAFACRDNMYTGNLTPVPPVHRLPAEVAGAVILIDKDPTIETKDPTHIARANEQRVPQQYREAMTKALALGGFRIATSASAPHDLVGKLAIAVSEEGDSVTQVYRCGLAAPDGTPVAQIDWTWPKGTYVETLEVLDFATHNVATDVVTSPRVLAWLKSRGGKANAPQVRSREGG
jgi:hypothetical protein